MVFLFYRINPEAIQGTLKGDETRRVIAHLTKRQYYADGHFTKNKRKNERWNTEIEEVLEELNRYVNAAMKIWFASLTIRNLNCYMRYSTK